MQFDGDASHSFAHSKTSSPSVVSYFYDPEVGSYYYGPGHPMKPQRIRMAHSLILGYDLYRHMDVYRPHDATATQLTQFHDAEYVNFLASVNVDNYKALSPKLPKFNLGESSDCPIFDGLFEFQSSCAGASIDAAVQLNHKTTDVVLNWSGGLHHAKRAEASGFCYINDIVLAILELLKYHTRVMYIDIDIHHGDGVEEAFYLCHRVMTVSFHKYGEYFPGTGDHIDVGGGSGKYYSVNVPLNDGVVDELYVPLYKDIITRCINVFRPEAIVLQCGADSVTGDRLGNFNLSTKGHGACVEWTKSLGIPILILGGGGYTIKNVARAWLYETAIALDMADRISGDIPPNEYYQYFGPNYQLHLEPNPALQNKNSVAYCDMIREKIFNNLSHLEPAPSVGFSTSPPDFYANVDGVDENQCDEQIVEWEGGGLAVDQKILIPHKLRRRDYHDSTDQFDDRDQRYNSRHIRLADGYSEQVEDGDDFY